MPTKNTVKVTTGLTIQGFKQYDPPEFRSKAGRLVARGVPVVEGVAPAGISLTPPLLCFLESDMAKRNMVPIGPAVPIENEQLLAAKRRAKLHPFNYKAGLLAHTCYPSEHIQKYNTKEDVPVEVEEIERGISLGFVPDRPRWYVSSVDVYMNGEPVVITEKAKPKPRMSKKPVPIGRELRKLLRGCRAEQAAALEAAIAANRLTPAEVEQYLTGPLGQASAIIVKWEQRIPEQQATTMVQTSSWAKYRAEWDKYRAEWMEWKEAGNEPATREECLAIIEKVMVDEYGINLNASNASKDLALSEIIGVSEAVICSNLGFLVWDLTLNDGNAGCGWGTWEG